MQSTRNQTHQALCLTVLLSSALLGPQLFAFEQGSFFLFDIREDASEAVATGRIAVASSAFKSETSEADTRLAEDEPKSEFETEVTSLKTKTETAATGGIEMLESEIEKPKTKTSFGDEFGESSFGEDQPSTGGFFFTY